MAGKSFAINGAKMSENTGEAGSCSRKMQMWYEQRWLFRFPPSLCPSVIGCPVSSRLRGIRFEMYRRSKRPPLSVWLWYAASGGASVRWREACCLLKWEQIAFALPSRVSCRRDVCVCKEEGKASASRHSYALRRWDECGGIWKCNLFVEFFVFFIHARVFRSLSKSFLSTSKSLLFSISFFF